MRVRRTGEEPGCPAWSQRRGKERIVEEGSELLHQQQIGMTSLRRPDASTQRSHREWDSRPATVHANTSPDPFNNKVARHSGFCVYDTR
jgi:hypothetical protein